MEVYAFLLASILLTISPGPDILYVLNLSLFDTKKNALILATGLVSGIIIHTSFVAFGLAAIINQTRWLFWLIKIFGSLYLFYLAYSALVSSTSFELKPNQDTSKSMLKVFTKGFLMNVLNPKVTMFFLALLPSFVAKQNWDQPQYFFLLGFIFMIQAWIIFYLVVKMASFFAHHIQHKSKQLAVFDKIKYLQALILLIMGVVILI